MSRPPFAKLFFIACVALALFASTLVVTLGGVFSASPGLPRKTGNIVDPLRVEGEADPGSFGLLFIGVDYTDEAWRQGSFRRIPAGELRALTDTLIYARINLEAGQVTAVSIPRDTVVSFPGIGEDKINHGLVHGRLPLLTRAVEGLLSTDVDRFVIVDFQGFVDFIDGIGGIEFELENDLKLPDGSYLLRRGTHHLDGAEALRVVRHRWPHGDLHRIKRQQRFLLDLFEEMTADGLSRAFFVLQKTPHLIKTDLSWTELYWLYRFARRIEGSSVTFLTIEGTPREHYWIPKPESLEEIRRRLRLQGAEEEI